MFLYFVKKVGCGEKARVYIREKREGIREIGGGNVPAAVALPVNMRTCVSSSVIRR